MIKSNVKMLNRPSRKTASAKQVRKVFLSRGFKPALKAGEKLGYSKTQVARMIVGWV